MPIYIRDSGGVLREVKKVWVRDSGVLREMEKVWTRDSGALREVFSAEESVIWTGQLRRANNTSGTQSVFGSVNTIASNVFTIISGLNIPADWMASNTAAFLTGFFMVGTGGNAGFVQFHLSFTDGASGGDGQELLSSIENNGLRIDVTAGTSSVSVIMNSGTIDDISEPYAFKPSNSSEVITFVDGLSIGLHNTTLKLARI